MALATMMTLAGCLSEDSSNFAGDPGDTPPPANSAPTISGTPSSSVKMGDPYSFTPVAVDADNDPLTFSVQGEPNWLGIDSGTGALTGTPLLANVVMEVFRIACPSLRSTSCRTPTVRSHSPGQRRRRMKMARRLNWPPTNSITAHRREVTQTKFELIVLGSQRTCSRISRQLPITLWQLR